MMFLAVIRRMIFFLLFTVHIIHIILVIVLWCKINMILF